MLRLFFICLFIPLTLFASYSQNAIRRNELKFLEDIEVYLEDLDSLLFKKEPTPSIAINQYQYQEIDIDFTSNQMIDELIEMQKSAYNAKTGLSMQLLYGYQMGVSIIDYSMDDEIYPYRNRVQASLNWNITESSLLGRKTAHKIFEIEAMQMSSLFQKEGQRLSKREQLTKITDKWDYMISLIHFQRLGILNEVFGLREYLYNYKKIMYSDIALIKREMLEIRSLMTVQDSLLIGVPMQQIDIDSYQLNLSVDTLGLFDIYIENNIDLKQYGLDQERLGLNRKSLSYFNQMRVGVFVRAQCYDKANSEVLQGKMDVGVSATFPLSREYRKRRSLISYEIAISQREELYAKESVIVQYENQIRELTRINNKLTQEFRTLEIIEHKIANYELLYRRSVSSLEKILFEYDVYLIKLSDIYQIIKEREILITTLIN